MKKYIITPGGPLKGEIRIPGDKSISHRAVMIGSIAEGETIVENFLISEDCLRTVECMRLMGTEIEFIDGNLKIKGKGLTGLSEPGNILDVGNSGTTIRLLMGILSGQSFKATLTGDESIRRRPMGRVVEPLKKMGAVIHGRQKDTLAPLTVIGSKLKPIDYVLPIPSAQVKGAILLAGLYADGETSVVEREFTRDHTERMLEYFGAEIRRIDSKIILKGRPKLRGQRITVPSDISSASYLLVAGTIVPDSEITLRDIGVNPGRTGIIEVIHRMGGNLEVMNERIVSNEPMADIKVKFSRLKAVELRGSLIPRIIDEIPAIAVAATQAIGKTVIKDAEELRLKESDRINTMVKELTRLGVKVEELKDGMIINGGAKLKSAVSRSYGDHRIAMAVTIAGLIAEGRVVMENVDCVDTSFPHFADTINKLSSKPLIEII